MTRTATHPRLPRLPLLHTVAALLIAATLTLTTHTTPAQPPPAPAVALAATAAYSGAALAPSAWAHAGDDIRLGA